jgi:hypothetical protein
MANVTWNSADKVSITLSGTNSLTATSGAGVSGVRTTGLQGSGKYYFEFLGTTLGGTNLWGVANAAAVLSTALNTNLNIATVARSGTVIINNVQQGVTALLGTIANGNIVGVALDVTNNLIWFRIAPSGNWNASGTGNPTTGVGGFSITSIATGLYGFFAANGSGIVTTANFGDTAFSGAVPSGFTSGFPTGGVPPTSGLAIRAMVLA